MDPEQLIRVTAFLSYLKVWKDLLADKQITINMVKIFVEDSEDAYTIEPDDDGFYLSPGWPDE